MPILENWSHSYANFKVLTPKKGAVFGASWFDLFLKHHPLHSKCLLSLQYNVNRIYLEAVILLFWFLFIANAMKDRKFWWWNTLKHWWCTSDTLYSFNLYFLCAFRMHIWQMYRGGWGRSVHCLVRHLGTGTLPPWMLHHFKKPSWTRADWSVLCVLAHEG